MSAAADQKELASSPAAMAGAQPKQTDSADAPPAAAESKGALPGAQVVLPAADQQPAQLFDDAAHSGIESTLNDKQREVLEGLRELHKKHLDLEKQYRVEWNALKLKYFKTLKPLYEERYSILSAKKGAEGAESGGAVNSAEVATLPDFWLTALRNNSNIGQAIEPHDLPVLKFLSNITFEWVNEEEQMSFRFIFHFAPNPYFSNSTLTKTYELEEDPDVVESVLTMTEGTEILWKEGVDVTKKTVTRRQKNKKTGQMRTITQEVSRESFFNIFESREVPNDAKLENMSAEEVTDLENTLELEYEIGCVIRDKIIPHAIGWYLGTEVDDEDIDSGDDKLDDSDDDSNKDCGSEDDVTLKA